MDSKNLHRQWTREETEVLLDLIERVPCLYDKKHKDFRNKDLKTDAARQIAEHFQNCTGPDVSYRLQALRDRAGMEYRIYKGKITAGNGAEDATKRWPFYDKASFLREGITFHRAVRSSRLPAPVSQSASTPESSTSQESTTEESQMSIVIEMPAATTVENSLFCDATAEQAFACSRRLAKEAVTPQATPPIAEPPTDFPPPNSQCSAMGSSHRGANPLLTSSPLGSGVTEQVVLLRVSEILNMQNKASTQGKEVHGFGAVVNCYLEKMSPRTALLAQQEMLSVLIKYCNE